MSHSPTIPHIYHSSPDHPVLTGREVRRETLLSRLVDAWRAGHRVLGLYGPGGIGKTIASVHAVAAICGSGGSQRNTRLRISHILWLELRICPNAGGLLSQLADCLQEMEQPDLARQLRSEVQPAPQPLAYALAQALGPDCLLIVDQCETVLDNQGQIANPYLRELLAALFGQTGWRGLLTVRTSRVGGGTGQKVPSATLLAWEENKGGDGRGVDRIHWFPVEALFSDERTALLRLTLPSSPLRWNTLNGDTQRLILTEMAGHPYIFTLFLADPGDDPTATIAEIRRRAADGAGEYAAMDHYVGRAPLAVRPMLELLAILEDREPWPFLEGAWQAVGSVLGWPVRGASATLAELTRRALVEEGPEGYRILPVVRHYLLSRPPPLGLPEGLASFFHHHLARLYGVLAKKVKEQTQDLVTRARGDSGASQQAVVELIRYHAVLRDRGLRQALYHGNLRAIRGALEGLVEPIPWQLNPQLTVERCLAYTQQLTVLVEKAAAQPGDDGRPAEVGACYHVIGRVCEEIRATKQSLTAYQSALDWWERTRQTHRMGGAWLQIGKVLAGQQQWSESLTAYRTALDWWERTRQYPQMGGTWHRIGKLYADQERWSDALTAYHTALDWQGRTNRQRESSGTWLWVGEAHEAQQQFGPAALAYTQALELLRTYDAGPKPLEFILGSARRLLAATSVGSGEELERLRGIVQTFQKC
ncbi:hypothetical protein CCP3SC1_410002 [Gammaproteobacteria bacterium]